MRTPRPNGLALLPCLIFIASLGSVWPLQSAHAYNLDDHKRITLQAVAEFNQCFPGLITDTNLAALWTSDLEEDADLIRKDILYSHFYNPYKHLDMRRYDSSVRVERLEDTLIGDSGKADPHSDDVFSHLGHMVHHLQDMSVPPHVVPVMHWLNDGFEKYALKGEISSGLSCADLMSGPLDAPNELLIDTAKQTLATVAAVHVRIGAGKTTMNAGGDFFWKASDDDSFGDYGSLGNNYGSSTFVQNGTSYSVPDSFYASFKQTQMKRATRATLRALYWYLTAIR